MNQPVSQLEYWNGAPRVGSQSGGMDASLADATAGLFSRAANRGLFTPIRRRSIAILP
jgi:hypothetical protein